MDKTAVAIAIATTYCCKPSLDWTSSPIPRKAWALKTENVQMFTITSWYQRPGLFSFFLFELTVDIVDLEQEFDLVFRGLAGKLVHCVQEFLVMMMVMVVVIVLMIQYVAMLQVGGKNLLLLLSLTLTVINVSVIVIILKAILGMRWIHCRPCRKSGTLAPQRKAGGRISITLLCRSQGWAPRSKEC